MRFIYLLLFISPLPFASARPVWQYFWVIFIGFSGLIYAIRWKSLNDAKLPKVFYFPVGATLFLIFWGVLQVQLGWSVTPQHTITTTLYFFSHLVWFFLVFKSFKRQSDVPKLILMLGLIATIYCIYGLIVYFTGNETILWYDKWVGKESVTSTFVNRNSFAAYAGIGFQCMLAYTLWTYFQNNTATASLKEKLIHFLSKDLTRTVGATLSFSILLTSLFLTASRAGIVTSLIGAVLLLSLPVLGHTHHHDAEAAPKRRYITVASITVLALLAFTLSGELFSKRMGTLNENDQRFLAYPLMVDALEETPIKGIGIGTFAEVFAQYRTHEIPLPLNKGHSDILETIMTSGVISGTLFILSMMFITVWLCRKGLASTEYSVLLLLGSFVSVQIGLHSLVDFSLQMPAVSYLYMTLLSASAFLSARNKAT